MVVVLKRVPLTSRVNVALPAGTVPGVTPVMVSVGGGGAAIVNASEVRRGGLARYRDVDRS